jgi:hypothetical protein
VRTFLYLIMYSRGRSTFLLKAVLLDKCAPSLIEQGKRFQLQKWDNIINSSLANIHLNQSISPAFRRPSMTHRSGMVVQEPLVITTKSSSSVLLAVHCFFELDK